MMGALKDSQSSHLANALVRPVLREVEAFRFSTVRLDLRENSARLHDTLSILWRASTGETGEPPPVASKEWKAWLLAELGKRNTEAVHGVQHRGAGRNIYSDVVDVDV